MNRFIRSFLPAVCAAIILTGCGGTASEDKPLSEIQQEAPQMSAAQLESMVQKYTRAIESKKSELEALQAKIKEIPLKEALGDEAKALKNDLSEIQSSVKNLTDRLNAYAQALKEKAASAE